MAGEHRERSRARSVQMVALGALLVAWLIWVVQDRSEAETTVLVWQVGVDVQGGRGASFPPAVGPSHMVPDTLDVQFDAETGCFFEGSGRRTVIVWPPGTTSARPGVVTTAGGAEIAAPISTRADEVGRFPIRALGDQIEDLGRCVTEDTVRTALVRGIDDPSGD